MSERNIDHVMEEDEIDAIVEKVRDEQRTIAYVEHMKLEIMADLSAAHLKIIEAINLTHVGAFAVLPEQMSLVEELIQGVRNKLKKEV